MKKYVFLGISLCVAVAFTSCKSSESAYKKAYEKAKQQEMTDTQKTDQTTTQVEVNPVQPTTPVTTTVTQSKEDNTPVRTESVELVSGSGLKAYSVVCGSFSLKANAEGLQSTLKSKGYDAQIAYNSSNSMYRVIASTFAEKSSAVQSRDQLRGTYPDAWLLFKK